MSEVFVTLFDSLFIPQGLALYNSLTKQSNHYKLVIICLDDDCYELLNGLNLNNLILINLAEYESNKLKKVKKDRSRREYCWTLTPFSIQWAFEKLPEAERVTYLDADIFFLKSPEGILHEFEQSGKSFLITEHSYSPFYDQTFSSGRYCVQFVTVTRNKGFKALYYWRDACLDWCFAKHEDGKFGDQKYIEDIASIYENDVLALRSDPRLLAPWNMDIYRYSDAVLFHFHEFRIINSNSFVLTKMYPIPTPVKKHIYKSYISTLKFIEYKYKANGIKLKSQVNVTATFLLKIILSSLLSRILYCIKKLKSSITIHRN